MTAKHIQEAWDKLRQERDELAALLAAAEQRSDELAAQVEVMRDALEGAVEYTTLLDDFTQAAMREALALPNPAAAILRQRDARVLREVAQSVEHKFDFCGDELSIGDFIREMADKMERKNG